MSEVVEALQVAYLDRVISWAERSREVLESLAIARSGEVHFRPSANGVAMVGLRMDRPQRGKSGFRDLSRLARDLDALYDRHCRDIPQGRPTPEKRLQSWMTAEAYRNERRMMSLESAVGDGIETVFVADELALPLGEKRRIVCDMLALRREPSGECRLAVIELKSAREMKRLIAQVVGYADWVDAQPEGFERLVSAVLGIDIEFSAPAERWIVWPRAGESEDPREAELAAHGIRIVGYTEQPEGFSFRVGRSV